MTDNAHTLQRVILEVKAHNPGQTGRHRSGDKPRTHAPPYGAPAVAAQMHGLEMVAPCHKIPAVQHTIEHVPLYGIHAPHLIYSAASTDT